MGETASRRFKTEIRHFYMICIMNFIFAALAMSFGISIFVQKLLSLTETTAITESVIYSVFILLLAVTAVISGFFWLLKSITIFEGVESIKDEFDEMGAGFSEEEITGLIIKMLSHYRDNKDSIGKMILVCTIAGICFFLLGIIKSIEFIIITPASVEFSLNCYLVIPGMIFTLAIAFTSLYSSYYFSKFSKIWDVRLREIEESEKILQKTLET